MTETTSTRADDCQWVEVSPRMRRERMPVKFYKGAKHFCAGELVELGRRLTEAQLTKMQLLEAVMAAEQDHYWRVKAARDLLRDATGPIAEALEAELKRSEEYAKNPNRKGSKVNGAHPSYGEKRSLPEPGTLIVRDYKYQHPLPERRQPDGTIKKVSTETFRFVVVDTPSKLLRLGDYEGGIYLSVSGAASAATGSNTDGWRFFEISSVLA